MALLASLALCEGVHSREVPRTLDGRPPLVIAHRGASGYLPEETLESYRLAVEMGVDFIEPDLWPSKDGVLIVRHDRSLNPTTNVEELAAADPGLFAKGIVDDKGVRQYYIDQLELAEIKKLTARPGPHTFNTEGHFDPKYPYRVATFPEVLDYLWKLFQDTNKIVGVYPEAKAADLKAADGILQQLSDPKYKGFFDSSRKNVILQSFHRGVLQHWRPQTPLPLLQLGAKMDPAALKKIASYANGAGSSFGKLDRADIAHAHAAGLFVHPYTLTNDPAEYRKIYELGVDGVFSNNPDIALKVRAELFPPGKP